MASLKNIANSLDLSIALVSKVLSGKMGTTRCSEATKKAILAKAKEMGFRPNPLARALRSGRTGTIGVFVHTLGSPGSDLIGRLLMGLSKQANALEQRLCLSFYQTDKEFLRQFTIAARSEIDGLLVTGVLHPELIAFYKEIEKSGIPVVTMFRNVDSTAISVNIYCNDFQVGYLPTRHLLENGCKRIAHIRVLEPRYQGYLKALQEDGLEENPALVYCATSDHPDHSDYFGTEAGRQAVRFWIKNNTEFDGLVAESDCQAFGAVTELLAYGLRVPEDVKVFGVDDSPICTISPVALSSVSLRVEEVGACGVDAILQLIDQEPVESKAVQPVLSLRASTGD